MSRRPTDAGPTNETESAYFMVFEIALSDRISLKSGRLLISKKNLD